MKKYIVTRKPLILAHETIRTLSHVELGRAAGASETDTTGSGFNCTTYAPTNCRPPTQPDA